MKRIIALLCAAAMLFALAGCGQKKTPEAVVDRFCGAAKKFDVVTMSRCMVDYERPDAGQSEEAPDITLEDIPMDVVLALREHAKTITYEVGEGMKNDRSAKVPVVLTYPDLSVAVGGAVGEYLAEALGMALSGATEEEMEGLFEEILARNIREAEPKMKTASLEFNCVMTENGWKIEIRPVDVINMLIGNIMNSIGQLDGLV